MFLQGKLSEILVERGVLPGSGLPTHIVIEHLTGDPFRPIKYEKQGAEYPIQTDAELLDTIKALHTVFAEVSLHSTGRGQSIDFIKFLERLAEGKSSAPADTHPSK